MLDNPFDKVFGAHPCWIMDFTPVPVMRYWQEKYLIDVESTF
jgi:hypothetical protein